MIQQHYATHFPMSGRERYTHKTTMELPSWMIYHLGFLLGMPYSSQPRISSPKVALWSVVIKKPKDFLLRTQIKMLIFIVGIQDPIENWFPFLPFEDLNFVITCVIHCWQNYDNAHDIFFGRTQCWHSWTTNRSTLQKSNISWHHKWLLKINGYSWGQTIFPVEFHLWNMLSNPLGGSFLCIFNPSLLAKNLVKN